MNNSSLNPMTMLYPQGVADQASIDQQRMLAQAILSQGMQPMQSNAMAGNVAYHVSPLEGLAKLLQTGIGMKMQGDANQQALALALRQQQAMGSMFGAGQQPQGQPAQAQPAQQPPAQPAAQPTDADNQQALASVPANGGPAGPTQKAALLAQALAQQGQQQQPAAQPQGQPQQTPAQSGGFSLPGMTPQQSMALYLMNPDEYTKTLLSYSAPTDATKMAIAAHQDPAKANAAVLQKQGYIEPVMGRPGTIGRDPITGKPLFFNPQIPNGGTPLFDASGNVVGMQTIPGAAQVESNMAAARTGGEGSMLPYAGVDKDGNPLPVTNRTQASTGYNQAPTNGYSGGSQGAADAKRLQLLQQELANARAHGATQEAAAIQREINTSFPSSAPQVAAKPQATPIYAAPPVGTDQLAKNGADTLNKVYSEASTTQQHRQILSEIQSLVNTGQFGPGTGGMARIRALASNLGIDMSKAQTDQDVMQKLSANLSMSQLGQGGTGTDAQLQTILHSVPNGQMTNDAIRKVIPLLSAQLDVKDARSKVVSSFMQSNGNVAQLPTAVAQFNQLAAPNVISLGHQMHQAAQNGTLKQYVQNLPPAWRTLLPKVQKLDEMGAF